MNSYNVKIRYEDRQKGSEGTTVKVDATTIAGAIAKAAREFIKGLDRKQRFDANKGLQIEAARVASPEAEAPESAKGATV
jgi:hypothetical protein